MRNFCSPFSSLHPGTCPVYRQDSSGIVLSPRVSCHFHSGFQRRSPGKTTSVPHKNDTEVAVRISVLSVSRTLNTWPLCRRDLTPEHIIESVNFRIFFVLIKICHPLKSFLESQYKPGYVGIIEGRGGNIIYTINRSPSERGVLQTIEILKILSNYQIQKEDS